MITIEEAKEFVEYVLPQLILKKDGTLSEEDKKYTWHKTGLAVSGCRIKQFKGGTDLLYYLSWGRLYEQFKEKELRPTHYREFEVEGVSYLELYSRGRRRDVE